MRETLDFGWTPEGQKRHEIERRRREVDRGIREAEKPRQHGTSVAGTWLWFTGVLWVATGVVGIGGMLHDLDIPAGYKVGLLASVFLIAVGTFQITSWLSTNKE